MPPLSIQQAFELAVQHHQAGRLLEAEEIYQQILAVQPNHADALQLAGVIAYQSGRASVAAELISQSLAIRPNDYAVRSNFGLVLRDLGRIEEAVIAYRQAAGLKPDHAEAHNNLGDALREQGKFPEAEAAFRRAIALKPGFAAAHYNLGNALHDQRRTEEAVAAYRQAIAQKPDLAEAHNNLGNVLRVQGHFLEAESAFRRAIVLKPDFAAAHYNLGNALFDQGRTEASVAEYRQAIALKPDYAEAHNNLGNALREQGELAEAETAFRRAIALKPDYSEAYNNLGIALYDQARIEDAAVAYRRAIELKPDYADAQFNTAVLLLLSEDYDRGWPMYESRWRVGVSAPRSFPGAAWTGAPLDGRRVLIYAEQGFGDAIEFVRYAVLVAGRGAEVILECPRPLVELLRTAEGVSEVVATGDILPPFDLHVAMLSLPLVFRTRRDSIPANVPYLSASPSRRENWQRRLGKAGGRLRVGIAWAGNLRNSRSRLRNLQLQLLLPLLGVAGVEFCSLQIGDGEEQIHQLPENVIITDYSQHIRDFADTAALMMELDLIISVDTAVAHLAGALGKSAWTLLPFVADWRWGLGGDATPWYPTMRLFRQPKLGDWDSVIQRVVEGLELLMKSRLP